MEIKVHGKHNHISASLERFAEEKLTRLNKYVPSISLIDVELYEEGRTKDGSHVAEVTVTTNGPSFRAKTTAADHRAAIDVALDRLSRQMSDYKRKSLGKPAHARHAKDSAPPALPDLADLVAAQSTEASSVTRVYPT
ncbi:MAG TPA: ribosome-associated translation inhibitor RaiA [Actinomycetota bacterium]|nr:ribosome-associated translation inhibitor RaiA [Actinomycetota bacterium]